MNGVLRGQQPIQIRRRPQGVTALRAEGRQGSRQRSARSVTTRASSLSSELQSTRSNVLRRSGSNPAIVSINPATPVKSMIVPRVERGVGTSCGSCRRSLHLLTEDDLDRAERVLKRLDWQRRASRTLRLAL